MKAAEVVLTSADRAQLRSWLAAGKTEQRLARRAAVILGVAEGLSNVAVAARVGVRPATVSKWRGRFARSGLAGLADAPRSGKPAHYDAVHERRILAALDEPLPAGYSRWDGALLAGIWPTFPSIRSGACCAQHRDFAWRGAAAGASAPIPALPRRRPMLSGSTCSRRTMRWCWRLTKSPTSRLWSGPRAG